MDLQKDEGLAYLFVSHDMAVVEKMSHRVAVLYLGQIMELGSRAQVFETPAHPYTRRLLSAVPVPDPTRRPDRAGAGRRGALDHDESGRRTRACPPDRTGPRPFRCQHLTFGGT
jgi:ABC-type oligopeptide transport system ATPase subunit